MAQVQLGVSPIAWTNDDLPELGGYFTLEKCLSDTKIIGLTGVEKGGKMPNEAPALQAALSAFDLKLCGGWCSGELLTHSVADEFTRIQAQLQLFKDLKAPYLVYAETSNTIQNKQDIPLSQRPRLSEPDLAAYARKLTELADKCRHFGMPLVYHHHMGTIVERAEEVDILMQNSGETLELLFDAGHLYFAGDDPLPVLQRWKHRVGHVHYKDVRTHVAEAAKHRDLSFLDAVLQGAFTVPGDGAVDFFALSEVLAQVDYHGWIVIEAEQDPAKADPYAYTKMGTEHTLRTLERFGIEVIS